MKKMIFKMFGMLCNEYKNGWYSVKKRGGKGRVWKYNLYRADGTLVAKGVYGCTVYDNGMYRLEFPPIPVSYDGPLALEEIKYKLYRPDGTLVADQLIDCRVENGTCTIHTAKGRHTFPC